MKEGDGKTMGGGNAGVAKLLKWWLAKRGNGEVGKTTAGRRNTKRGGGEETQE
jgi:hypothetical protein